MCDRARPPGGGAPGTRRKNRCGCTLKGLRRRAIRRARPGIEAWRQRAPLGWPQPPAQPAERCESSARRLPVASRASIGGGGVRPGPPVPAVLRWGLMETRRRYGRRRGRVPTGDKFMPRLGPAGAEPFATLDDTVDSWAPTIIPETPIESAPLRCAGLRDDRTVAPPSRRARRSCLHDRRPPHELRNPRPRNDRINPYARRIHGIDAATFNGAPPVSLVVERFQRFARGAVLVESSATHSIRV